MQLYRYIDMKASTDGGAPYIVLCVYPVVRETPACWVIDRDGQQMRVLKGDGKRFAHERHEWAKRSFLRRKSSQRWHLERQLQHATKLKGLVDDDFPLSVTPGEHFRRIDRMTDAVIDAVGFDFGLPPQ